MNKNIKNRFLAFKRRIRYLIISFTITFICVYCLIDYSIRTVVYQFLKEQNLNLNSLIKNSLNNQNNK